MNKKILSIIILTFLLLSLPVAVFLVKRQQEIRMRAAPSTTLAIDPAAITKIKGESFTLQITINTGNNAVISADLDINFNPQVLTATDISPGTFFENPDEAYKTINNTTGNILYAFASSTPKIGSGNLVSILFEAKELGTSSITFGPRTGTFISDGTDVLQQTSPGTVTITGAATPTPTPTPTSPPGTPTPTPTSPPGTTPTPTPTSGAGGLGPTATPTPTKTPTPTPTTAVGTTPIPTPTVSPEELPEAGNITPTFILIGFGILVLTSGLLLLF